MNLVAGKYPQKYHDHGPDGGFLNIATRPIASVVIKNEFEEFISPQQNDYDGESDGVPDERGPPLDQLPIGCLFHILFRISFHIPLLVFTCHNRQGLGEYIESHGKSISEIHGVRPPAKTLRLKRATGD
ncbi:MAG: hypothetical protein ACJASX_003053 [Limisphaerales bacterium]|jgi:hypothetical protein